MILVGPCLGKGKAERVAWAQHVVEGSSIGGDRMGRTILVCPGDLGSHGDGQALRAERKARDGNAVPATGRCRRWSRC